MPGPQEVPIGLLLTRTARALERAFDDALGEVGGSIPIWLVLLNLKIRTVASQRELAEAVGIRESTLSIHLAAMEEQGLVTRQRARDNRRVHVVELTSEGEAAFLRLRGIAGAFDDRLRQTMSPLELAQLRHVLERLATDVDASPSEGSASIPMRIEENILKA